jgi:hypothetical protein
MPSMSGSLFPKRRAKPHRLPSTHRSRVHLLRCSVPRSTAAAVHQRFYPRPVSGNCSGARARD